MRRRGRRFSLCPRILSPLDPLDNAHHTPSQFSSHTELSLSLHASLLFVVGAACVPFARRGWAAVDMDSASEDLKVGQKGSTDKHTVWVGGATSWAEVTIAGGG